MNIEPTPEMIEQGKIMKRMTLQLKLGFAQLEATSTAHLESPAGRAYHCILVERVRDIEHELAQYVAQLESGQGRLK